MKSRRPVPLLFSCTLALTLCALLLSGCRSRGSGTPADPAASPVTLEFWDFPHLPRANAHIQKTIADFERENPGVRIRYTKLPWLDGQQKVILSVNAGSPPDVCGQVNVSPQFIAQDVLEPVDPWIAPLRHDFHPSYLESVSYGGHTWAFPWYKACYVMVLNLDVFEGRGVEPPRNGRWTWDEFRQKMKALTSAEPWTSGSRQIAPRTWGLVTNLGPAEYEAYSILFNAGGRILQRQEDGSVLSTVGKPPFIEGLLRLQTLDFDDRVCFSNIGATNQDQSWNSWRDTRAIGVTIQGAWSITALEGYNRKLEESNARRRASGVEASDEMPLRWAIAAPPSDDPATTPVLASSGLGTYVMFKQKDERRRDLAARFLLKLITGEGQQVLKDENGFPSLRSTGNLWADDPALAPVFALFPEGITQPLVPGGERIDRVLQNEIQRALLQGPDGRPQISAEEAARNADRKVEAILDRAHRRFGDD